jgi:CubicO group peptidase (beta-lactamase class C family)
MRARALAFVLSLFLCFAAVAQDARIQQLEAFFEREMKAQRMPAISVAVKHGDFFWARGFGLADVDNNVPATEESSYRMGSVSKPFTAVAILKLADEGKLDLDAEVQTYVPYFPKKAHPITIRQLLAHLGGISHYRDYNKEGRIKEPKSTREALAIFQDFDLVAEPGTAYNYTSYGYNLLGAVIEGASGKPYGEYLAENVWKPLGMNATRMDDPRALIPHRVSGYVLEKGQLKRSEYVDISSRFGGGGTRSTVLDMIRFMEGLSNGKVLKPETREQAWSMAQTRERRYIGYGYGFGVFTRNGRYGVGHSGAQQETRTTMSYIPEGKLYIALASNFEDANLSRFEAQIIETFLGDPALPGMRASTLEDDRALAALQSIYANGLGYYSRYGRAMTTDPKELTAAFRYLRTSLDDSVKIDAGEHPVAGEPLTKIGSYMAAELAKRGSLDVYHREGALRFASDFAAVKGRLNFDSPFARRVKAWSDAWSTITPAQRSLDFSSPDVLAEVEKLTNVPVKPDYAGQLARMGERAAMAFEGEKALRIAKLGVATYPGSATLHGVLGVFLLMADDRETGMSHLRKSLEIDPAGYASARNLENVAKQTPEPVAAVVRKASRELHGN